jgi:hypothetical protein
MIFVQLKKYLKQNRRQMGKKENMKDILRILKYFPYFLFLVAAKPKKVDTSQQMKEGKKEIKKKDFFQHCVIFFYMQKFFPFFTMNCLKILNCFPYSLFLIATAYKRFFYQPKNGGKGKK